MRFTATQFEGLIEVGITNTTDARGSFGRAYCKREFEAIGFNGEWVQINHSYNRQAGTFRGFHFQIAPSREAKLIRVVTGAVMDTVVDLRKGSPTFLQKFSVELSAENQKMLFVPHGFAHGYITLRDETALIYHHSEFYDPKLDAGLRFNDPRIRYEPTKPILMVSDRDKTHPLLAEDFVGISYK